MTAPRLAAHVALLATCAAASSACTASDDAGYTHVRFDDDPASATYGVVDLYAGEALLRTLQARADSAGWSAVLSVHTEEAAASGAAPPVLGDHTIMDGRLRFVPRFPPVPGQGYRIHADASSPGMPDFVIDTLVRVARPARPPATRVIAVHPGGVALPANLLRIYIEFSAPMSVGEAWDRIRLLDDTGTPVEDALLLVPQELWDPERRRLTVLLDPGRIKSDLRPNRELGPPLRAGGTYTLVVDDTWSDADGLPLREGFRRTFSVTPADRTIPRPSLWRIEPPGPGGRTPVTLVLDEPLDWGLLHRLVTVHTAAGERLEGTIAVADDAMRWTFAPAAPWQAGGYVIRVRTDLEDLAGNNLREPFDVDLGAAPEPAVAGDSVDLAFMVR